MLFNIETVGWWILEDLGSLVLLAGAHCLKLSPRKNEEVRHCRFTPVMRKNPRPKWSLRQAGAFRLTKWKRKAWQAWSQRLARKEETMPLCNFRELSLQLRSLCDMAVLVHLVLRN